MFEMTTIEKIYKYLFENHINSDDISPKELSDVLKQFGEDEFQSDPVQNLSRDNTTYPENLFIQSHSDIAVVRRPRYRPHHKMHQHDFIEITYVYHGICTFIGPNHDKVSLKKGDLLLLATNTKHQLHTDADDSIVFHIAIRRSTFDKAFITLLDSQDVLSQFFSRVIYGSTPASYVLFELTDDKKISNLFLEMTHEMEQFDNTSRRMLNIYFEWLCVYLIRSYDYKIWIENLQSPPKDMVKILNYMRDNIKSITLKETARAFNYSKSYFCKIIKRYTGKTYGSIITELRMQKSCELLKNEQISIEEIASIVGYEDVSSFYRSFKRTYHITPSQFQQQNKAKAEINNLSK
ncbi:AraC family transcriptional regulator [Acetobacterium bakii]|uniref:HTH araC/xylS-type domain-containing protein n=1 Tax=Acetobacterium bakii TaxID=52689 RepID=A0A0L6TXM9_9FIRM|nr:AraC family transcriptional regulator [Acetobacterium bakii]KNZ41003.1 hypothetical protein AKG39_14275 [Acetobacterium bakii]